MISQSVILQNNRAAHTSRWTNSRCNFNGRCTTSSSSNKLTAKNRREKYFKNGILYIKIEDKVFKYPPKGGVLIFNHDLTKVLMVRNNYHPYVECQKWGFPKGHVKEGESFTNCAMRECIEETGMNLNIKSDHPYILVNNSRYYVFISNENISSSIIPVDTNEINAVQFIDLTDALSLTMNKEAAVILKTKIKLAKKIGLKVQL